MTSKGALFEASAAAILQQRVVPQELERFFSDGEGAGLIDKHQVVELWRTQGVDLSDFEGLRVLQGATLGMANGEIDYLVCLVLVHVNLRACVDVRLVLTVTVFDL